MKMRGVLVSLAALWIVVSTACAQVPTVPRFINYQGRLLDAEGVPRVGKFYITFSLQESDNTQVWTETHEVTLENDHSGLFSVLLGSNEPLELSDFPIDNEGDFGDILRYLQVSIAEDAESDPIPLTPRKEFVSVAYAFRASDADTLDGWHSVDMTGEGWDETTTLKSAQDHIADKNNPHEVTLDQLGHVDNNTDEEPPELNERGEPTGQEIRDWADDITQWGHSTLVENLNANYLQGYTAEQLISEAKKKDEVDPQVAEDLLDNYVPRWDDDLPNGQNEDVGMLVTSIIYVDPGADDTGVADDLVGIGTQNPAGKLEVQDLQDVALVVDSGTDKEAVIQLRENDSPVWTVGNDGDDGDKLKMSTSADLNESRLTVVREGNVGIGTDEPAARLHVVGDDTGDETALIVQNDGVAVDDAAAMIFRHGEDESGRITVIRNADGSADLKIESRAAGGLNQNQLYLKSDGKVGIGTDDPEQALEVNGNIKLTGDGGVYRVDGRLELQTTENNDIAIMPDGEGKVGVGTQTPGRMLHVDGEVQGDRFFGSDDDSNFLDLDNDDDALLSARNDVIVNADADSDDAGAISLRTKGATRVYVRNDGNVGIGTTGPGSTLHVQNRWGSQGTPMVNLENTHDGDTLYVKHNAQRSDMYVANFLNSAGSVLAVRGDGDVGVGVASPSHRLDVYKSTGDWVARIHNAYGPTAYLGHRYYAGYFSGQVGINTVPQYMLDLNGQMRIKAGSNEGINVDTAGWGGGAFARIFFREGGSPSYGGILGYDPSADLFRLNTIEDGTEVPGVSIRRATGQVGVGTWDPHYPLDVNGNTLVRGNLMSLNRIGAGTDDPRETLDVQGNAIVRGTLSIDGGDYRIQAKPAITYRPMLVFYGYMYNDIRSVFVPAPGGFIVSDYKNSVRNMHVLDNGDLIVRGKVWDKVSDSRLKLNRVPLEYGLTEVMALRPMRYDLAEWAENTDDGKIEINGIAQTNCIGLIAQDVATVVPEAVQIPEDKTKDVWRLSQGTLIPVLVKAIQEQQQQIDDLKKEIETLKNK